jgi:hypothetical protein
MNLKQINDYLIKEGYLISIRGKPILTNKYFRDILKDGKVSVTLPVLKDMQVVKQEQKKVLLSSGKELFKKFAEDAHVPFRVSNGMGGEYTVKSYSADATKIFIQIMNRVSKGELDYNILTASTRLYYAKGSHKKTLSNYFIEDVWEGEYMEFKKKVESGKVEQHIKKGLSDGNESNTLDL